jgi:hypothetical protein
MVAIEALIIIGIFLVLLFWAVWYRITNLRLRKKYEKINNGNTKQGKDFRRAEIARTKREVAGRFGEVPDADDSLPRPPQLTARELLSTTALVDNGETGNDDGKTSRSNGKTRISTRRNPFRRR